MRMASGPRSRPTAKFGSRVRCQGAGRPTAMAAGSGSSDEPWGFAPCHYGRWAHVDDRWAWVPGEFAPEPVYAPALVAFIPPPAIAVPVPVPIGAGAPVGWFPLAPSEVYWPAYTRNLTYIT